jgi:hypothetical protein
MVSLLLIGGFGKAQMGLELGQAGCLSNRTFYRPATMRKKVVSCICYPPSNCALKK